jgi:glycosyltransferase involved in cell wall biosynthesis
MVEHLSGRYDFFIVTRNTDYLETEPYKDVEYNRWVDFQSGVKVFYASKEFRNKKTFKRIVNEQIFDVAYVNGIYSWKYSILPLIIFKKVKIKRVVVASRGMLAASAINVKADKKRVFLKVAKLLGLYRDVIFHVTNEKEGEDVKDALGSNVKTAVASNLPRKELIPANSIDKKRGTLNLVSLARIAPEKNTLYALERLADLPDSSDDITFDIYGQIYNEDYWKECEKVIEALPGNITVNYKGTISGDEVGITIQKYHALFMPTRGENFGHVILESLSAARPVLVSDQTPWRDLELKKAGWDLPLHNNQIWIEKIKELIAMENKEYQQWSRGARILAEGYVSSPELLEGYKRLFDS